MDNTQARAFRYHSLRVMNITQVEHWATGWSKSVMEILHWEEPHLPQSCTLRLSCRACLRCPKTLARTMPSRENTGQIWSLGRQHVDSKDRATAHSPAFLKRCSDVNFAIDRACLQPGAQTWPLELRRGRRPQPLGRPEPGFRSMQERTPSVPH